jgi:hypothetical protein
MYMPMSRQMEVASSWMSVVELKIVKATTIDVTN